MKYGEGSMGMSVAPPDDAAAAPPPTPPAAQRPFAVFDIDGTVIRWQLYHAVVSELAKQHYLSSDAYERIERARMTWKQRSHRESFREYEHVLVAVYREALEQVKSADYERVVEIVFEEYKDQVYVYTRDLIRDLKAKNYLLFALSGSHQEIIAKLASYYGFDAALGSVYKQQDGHFNGEEEVILGRKHEVLQQLVDQHSATFSGSVAVGDSGGDASMLELVEHPIAFNPDQALFAEARKHGWQVVLERKNMVYHLEPKDGTFILAQTNL